ncbi:hypothetical protein BDP27DRAFT_1373579 [Rhodocollybia butyracea]|uniref:Uncharacterized protein n=1 Tax=Rhodocollybia butyracea TaxID=206335 RepID=A0A9P5TXY0_9AGAR|nr:hypothetical protein BDP27DRAFT_1373579 [Rhodocollybia butyracea]
MSKKKRRILVYTRDNPIYPSTITLLTGDGTGTARSGCNWRVDEVSPVPSSSQDIDEIDESVDMRLELEKSRNCRDTVYTGESRVDALTLILYKGRSSIDYNQRPGKASSDSYESVGIAITSAVQSLAPNLEGGGGERWVEQTEKVKWDGSADAGREIFMSSSWVVWRYKVLSGIGSKYAGISIANAIQSLTPDLEGERRMKQKVKVNGRDGSGELMRELMRASSLALKAADIEAKDVVDNR